MRAEATTSTISVPSIQGLAISWL